MIPFSEVIDRAGDLLLDGDHVRWTKQELVRWGNEAMGAILTRKPAAFAVNVAHTLNAGTKQTIPGDGSLFLDVPHNLKADGVTPGRSVRRTDRQLLDDTDPDWHAGKPSNVIRNYTFDDRVPKIFYTYPPAIAGTKVELTHAVLPAPIADEAGTLDIGREYLEPVVNYVAYRANSKDSEYANPNAAIAYYQAFEAALGGKTQAEVATSPNQAQNSV